MDRMPDQALVRAEVDPTQTHVVFLHGLRMNRHVMGWLQGRIVAAGYAVSSVGYPSGGRDYEHNVSLVAAALRKLQTPHIHLVAHSYGGVVALGALARLPEAPVRRVVLLGSPVAGCRAGVDVQRLAVGRWFVGASRDVWTGRSAASIPPGIEVGSIAGTARVGLGRFFTRIDGLNDGVVAVDETRLPGMRDHVVLPVAHSLMLVSSRVARQTLHFLAHGHFER